MWGKSLSHNKLQNSRAFHTAEPGSPELPAVALLLSIWRKGHLVAQRERYCIQSLMIRAKASQALRNGRFPVLPQRFQREPRAFCSNHCV